MSSKLIPSKPRVAVPILRPHPSTFVEGLKESTKIVSQDSRSLGRNSNLGPDVIQSKRATT
jgi:hypothetical protein